MKIFEHLPGRLPVCRGLSPRHPPHLRPALRPGLHQLPPGQPGAVGGELTLIFLCLSISSLQIPAHYRMVGRIRPPPTRHSNLPIKKKNIHSKKLKQLTGNNPVSGRPTESLRGGANIAEQHQGLHRGLERGRGGDHQKTA